MNRYTCTLMFLFAAFGFACGTAKKPEVAGIGTQDMADGTASDSVLAPDGPSEVLDVAVTDGLADSGLGPDSETVDVDPDVPPLCPVDVAPGLGLAVTRHGAVRGVVTGTVATYKGIPFAAPPVGDLRWKAPKQPACYPDILEATQFASFCPQKDFQQGAAASEAKYVGNEDCLYLNVWAPAEFLEPAQVLVYLHGGGNIAGGASTVAGLVTLFDGKMLAERTGSVVVTIQYRLGPLGFLTLPELASNPDSEGDGNYGLLDQIAALRWVQQNIASFGGDPSRVLVFGESAGAVDVCALIASPEAKGLFHAALMQSGSCVATPLDSRTQSSALYAQSIGCPDGPDRLACLRALSPEVLTSKLEHPFSGGLAGQSGFGPTVDGFVLPTSPMSAIEAGQHNHVALLLGSNADETQITVPVGSVSPQTVTAALGQFPEPFKGQLLEMYPPGTTYEEARLSWIRATTDAQFLCPARRIARAAVVNQDQPVWRYYFTHKAPPNYGEKNGSFHGLELFYVFGGIELMAMGAAARDEDRLVVSAMQTWWARFAAAGNPNVDDLPSWPQYVVESDPAMLLSAPLGVGQSIRSEYCDLWDSISAF